MTHKKLFEFILFIRVEQRRKVFLVSIVSIAVTLKLNYKLKINLISSELNYTMNMHINIVIDNAGQLCNQNIIN